MYPHRFSYSICSQADGVNDIPDFFLPGPNPFIPSRLDVDKKDDVEVCCRRILTDGIILIPLSAPEATTSYP